MVPRKLNISDLLEKNHSFFLFGPRGTGKSSLLQRIFKNKDPIVFDFLRAPTFMRYLKNPGVLGTELRQKLSDQNISKPICVVIDEVQKIPQILDEVHSLLFEAKGKIFFALSGSSARKLRRHGANLLAGRAINRFLHPLSSREIDVLLDRALQFGTLPDIYLNEGLEIAKLESYVSTYLRDEIQAEALVRSADKFARFIEVAAQMNGEPINFTKLAKQCGVSTKTAQEYFEIMVDTLIVTRVDGWAHSKLKQLMQAPRFWFFDCGVLNAINGELRTELMQSSFRYGRLFETFVFQEIVRLNDDLSLGLRFNYWRDAHGHEVDLIISRQTAKPLIAVEIKSSEKPLSSEFKNLRMLKKEYSQIQTWCVCRTPQAYEDGDILVLPWKEALRKIESGIL